MVQGAGPAREILRMLGERRDEKPTDEQKRKESFEEGFQWRANLPLHKQWEVLP
jgi:hypothetical protein